MKPGDKAIYRWAICWKPSPRDPNGRRIAFGRFRTRQKAEETLVGLDWADKLHVVECPLDRIVETRAGQDVKPKQEKRP